MTSLFVSLAKPSVAAMSISQMRAELAQQYGITNLGDCFEVSDVRQMLTTTRDTRPVTYSLGYGSLMQIGNTRNPTGIVTMSHGLGDSGSGWADAVAMFARALPYLLFLLPTAPERPVTLNGGMSMNAWFDIPSLDFTAKCDADGIFKSAEYLTSLAHVAAKTHSVDPRRVVYAGFSQGSAISLAAGLLAPIEPAGIVSLSGFLVPEVAQAVVNHQVPVLLCHGTADQVVPYFIGQKSAEALAGAGVPNVDFRTYAGLQHSSSMKEIEDVIAFLRKVLPPLA